MWKKSRYFPITHSVYTNGKNWVSLTPSTIFPLALKQRLKAAGYDYNAVQAKVNELCGVKTKPTTAKPKPEAPKKQTVTLPVSAPTWRVYKTNVAPIVGNECGKLKPSKFGGLTYEILAEPQKDVVTIQTQDYGKVNIYVGPGTGAIIK